MTRQAKVHLALTWIWAIAMIPSILFFRNSVLWVGLLSCYALAASHWSAYEAVRSGVDRATLEQIRSLTDALAVFMRSYHQNNPGDERLECAINELRASLAPPPEKRDQ